MAEYRDLTEARISYISGNESLAALQKRLKIPKKVMEDASVKEGWVKQRREFRESLARDTLDRISAEKSKEIEKELLQMQQAANRLSDHILTVLNDPKAFIRQTITGESYYDAKAVSDMARALKDNTATLRNIYGLPTVQEREKMEMERKKAAAASGETEDGGGVVELAPLVEGEA